VYQCSAAKLHTQHTCGLGFGLGLGLGFGVALQRWASERVGHGKLLLRCRLLSLERRFGANGGEESGGCILWQLPAYSLFILTASSPWGESSVGRSVLPWGELSVGRDVHGAKRLCGEMSFHGAKCPWGEMSMG